MLLHLSETLTGQQGERLSVSAARKTGEPVRRHSRPAGRSEGLFYRKINGQEAAQIRIAAARYERATRQPGARSGALGFVAIEVVDYLTRLVDFRTGRLDPSIDYLMQKLTRSRAAIVRALKALRAHGFIDWLRRYIPTHNEGRGPQVQQTSNAYRLMLPKAARALLGRLAGRAPVPDDFAHAQAERLAQLDAHEATLSLSELPLFRVDDPDLAAALSALGAAVMRRKEREFTRETESPAR